ncbi:MAG TPA: hypothetical protein VLY03_12445 [Bacteroidota bacterium]|nr:hypothetical protein [Bacteroidota bacterium]
MATKRVMLFKTELHPKNNGPHLPFIKLVQQLVMEVKPELVITTGTAGGVGKNLNCGDVVITDTARLHCKSQYSDYPAIYELSSQNVELKSGAAFNNKYVNYAAANFTRLSLPGLYECFQKLTGRAGYSFLKKNTSVPMLYVKGVNSVPGSQPMDIVSADYLTVDHEYNSEGLQALGIMNDTDDAFAAYAMNSLPASKRPKWLSIRNASEPQVVAPPFPAATSPSKVIDTLKGLAGPIYGVYQYCTTFNSVFACWGIIAGMTT